MADAAGAHPSSDLGRYVVGILLVSSGVNVTVTIGASIFDPCHHVIAAAIPALTAWW
jgi:hypothetical protein